jgi:hypothetical protein
MGPPTCLGNAIPWSSRVICGPVRAALHRADRARWNLPFGESAECVRREARVMRLETYAAISANTFPS